MGAGVGNIWTEHAPSGCSIPGWQFLHSKCTTTRSNQYICVCSLLTYLSAVNGLHHQIQNHCLSRSISVRREKAACTLLGMLCTKSVLVGPGIGQLRKRRNIPSLACSESGHYKLLISITFDVQRHKENNCDLLQGPHAYFVWSPTFQWRRNIPTLQPTHFCPSWVGGECFPLGQMLHSVE